MSTGPDSAPVGFVGIGRMGGAMVRALARARRPLVLHNRHPDRALTIAAELQGLVPVRVAGSPAEVARSTDVTLTMLADDDALAEVYGGPEGLLAGARPGNVLVDLSTVSPGALASFAERATSAGVGLLDAPVSGSTATAAAGQLTLMVGGEAAHLELARPALEPLAKAIFHLGPLGTGSAMKLAVNTVIFGLNGALSEGLALAELAGIDREAAYDVLAVSAIAAPYVGYKRDAFLRPHDTPVAFTLAFAEKDLDLITTFARSLGVPVPQAEANLALVRRASAGGGGERDFSILADDLRAAAGRDSEEAPGS